MKSYVDRTRPALSFVAIGIVLQNYVDATVHEILGTPTTRIPKTLHRKLKLHCVTAGTPLMEFVGKAIAEKLARQNARRKR